ncbi:MAG: hypothetical protein U0169_24010 [Polyangiaceae bacterium]
MRALTRGAASGWLVLAASTTVACSAKEPTGIRYTPRSNLELEESTFVVRVFGGEGRLDMCGIYPVDESREPADTVSLVRFASTLVLVPRDAADGAKVRVVAELFGGRGVPDTACSSSGPRPTPLVRKVFLANFSGGHVLPIGTTFDVACLGVVECDESRETCTAGKCASADVLEATGDVSGDADRCLDLGACSTAVDVGRLDASCTVDLPGPAAAGTLIATFRLATAGSDATGASAVLDPSDFTVVAPDRVEFVGRTCDLVREGFLESVAYVAPCTAASRPTVVCSNAPSSSIASVASTARTDGGASKPDATVPDAASDSGSFSDATPDVRDATVSDASHDAATSDGADATSDAGGDSMAGSNDSGADSGGDGGLGPAGNFDGSTPDGGDSGSDSGSTGPEPTTPGVVLCGAGPEECSILDDRVCCVETTSTQCQTSLGCQGTPDRYECDDADDCPANQVCCRFESAQRTESKCLSSASCAGTPGSSTLCSPARPNCPGTGQCALVRPNDTVARRECVPMAGNPRVPCYLNGTPATFCGSAAGGSVCCEDYASPTLSACVTNTCRPGTSRWECDDASDCPFGYVCCGSQSAMSSACTLETLCRGQSGSEILCTDTDARCPNGGTCSGTFVPAMPTRVVKRFCSP